MQNLGEGVCFWLLLLLFFFFYGLSLEVNKYVKIPNGKDR